MREYCLFYLTTFFIIWSLLQVQATERKHEKNQQTFVVRYKNGDQTIPVTVVVDSKKQTEYVINMSPRNPEKSVTLYDFKQRTIAYKDLTNRECFLGRLHGETLKHEIDALREIQNPIEGNPKVLSLDPFRSALTPTEIRNIAGQKTAVFCRKMSTWLIIPHRTHNILKRNVDEIEERTYRHHGFHTVQYSHYGHETTRRYRIPSNATSHLVHRMKHPYGGKHQQLESLISNTTFEDNLPNGQTPHFHEHEYSPDQEIVSKEKVIPYQSSPLLPKTNFRHREESSVPLEDLNPKISDRTSGIEDLNSNVHNFPSGYIDNQLKNEFILENNSEINKTHERLISPIHERYIEKHDNSESHHSNLHELPLYSTNYKSDHNRYLPSVSHHPVEIELNSKDLSLSTLPKENIFSVDHITNPGLPINSLEIHKVSPNFDAGHEQEFLKPHIQPAEDVHTIFEGFHNLKENDSSSRTDYLYNVPFEVSEVGKNDGNHYNNARKSNYPVIATGEHSTNPLNTYELNTLFPDRHTEFPTTENYYSTTTSPLNLENNSFEGKSNRKLWQTDRVSPENKKSPHPTDSDMNSKVNESSISNGKFSLPSQILEKGSNFNAENPIKNTDLHGTPTHPSSESFNANYTQSQLLFPIHTTSVQEGLEPNQARFQNILRHYKPDEIVIDLERISTERPPNSISRFQTKPNSAATQKVFPNLTRGNEISGREHILKAYPRGNLQNISNSRKINNMQKHARNRNNFHFVRKSSTRPSNADRNFFSQPSINNFHHLNEPQRQHLPEFFNQPPRLDALPPGVSLHPRHPQAPYANMVPTNVLQPIPQQNNHRSHKPHRQRHHRRKDVGNRSCCGKSGLSSCCSGHSGRRINPKLRCCSQHKSHDNLRPFDPRHNFIVHPRNKIIPSQMVLRDTPPVQGHSRNENVPFQGRRTMKDDNSRCQKEKMCRTLYESTQQVMVCRNINIEGC